MTLLIFWPPTRDIVPFDNDFDRAEASDESMEPRVHPSFGQIVAPGMTSPEGGGRSTVPVTRLVPALGGRLSRPITASLTLKGTRTTGDREGVT